MYRPSAARCKKPPGFWDNKDNCVIFWDDRVSATARPSATMRGMELLLELLYFIGEVLTLLRLRKWEAGKKKPGDSTATRH